MESLPPETLCFPSNFWGSNSTEIYKTLITNDHQKNYILYDDIDTTERRISRILVDGKYCMVAHFSQKDKHFFSYFDENMQYIKQTEYNDKCTNVKLIADGKFIFRHEQFLVFVDLTLKTNKKPGFIIHRGDNWLYKLDDDNNIILAYYFEMSPAKSLVAIRQCLASENYRKSVRKTYVIPGYSKNNMLYAYILNRDILSAYGYSCDILNAYYDKVMQIYYVIFYDAFHSLVQVDSWICNNNKWIKTVLLTVKDKKDFHKINLEINRTDVEFGIGNTYYKFILPEDHKTWQKRIHQILSNIPCIIAFSDDLLLLLLSYIA
jgi:hypothetical protein